MQYFQFLFFYTSYYYVKFLTMESMKYNIIIMIIIIILFIGFFGMWTYGIANKNNKLKNIGEKGSITVVICGLLLNFAVVYFANNNGRKILGGIESKKNVDNKQIKMSLFGDKDVKGNETDISKIKITETSVYSTTPFNQSQETIYKLVDIMGTSDLIITDANSHVGGDTINFAKKFTKINAVEIDPDNYKLLKNNLDVLKVKNVTTYNNDYIEIMDKLKQDVVYFDPPWGGKDYKIHETMDLYLSDKYIGDIINKLISKARCVVLKIPSNFDINKFYKNNKFGRNICLFKHKKYSIIFLT